MQHLCPPTTCLRPKFQRLSHSRNCTRMSCTWRERRPDWCETNIRTVHFGTDAYFLCLCSRIGFRPSSVPLLGRFGGALMFLEAKDKEETLVGDNRSKCDCACCGARFFALRVPAGFTVPIDTVQWCVSRAFQIQFNAKSFNPVLRLRPNTRNQASIM